MRGALQQEGSVFRKASIMSRLIRFVAERIELTKKEYVILELLMRLEQKATTMRILPLAEIYGTSVMEKVLRTLQENCAIKALSRQWPKGAEIAEWVWRWSVGSAWFNPKTLPDVA